MAKKVKGIWIVMKRKTEKRERGWAKQNILTLLVFNTIPFKLKPVNI